MAVAQWFLCLGEALLVLAGVSAFLVVWFGPIVLAAHRGWNPVLPIIWAVVFFLGFFATMLCLST